MIDELDELPRAHVVVAHFEEDLGWTHRLPFLHFVYTKGDAVPPLGRRAILHRLANVGRESHTYLHHIVENYDDLPEAVVFLQANPFDHCLPTVVEDLPLAVVAAVDDGFVSLSRIWTSCSYEHPHVFQDQPENADQWRESVLVAMHGRSLPARMRFGSGACFCVNRAAILSRPRSEWRAIMEWQAAGGAWSPRGYAMEALWPTIFGYPDACLRPPTFGHYELKDHSDPHMWGNLIPADYGGHSHV